MTTTDPFSTPGPPRIVDRSDVDPFAVPGAIGASVRQGDAEDRAEIPRDQYDRYLMPQLDGTKPAINKGFTRVSTTKSALSNTIGIQRWTTRRVIQGIGKNASLVEAAMRAAALPEDREREKAFGKVADQAYAIGGGKDRAGLGTEFHEITEMANRGDSITVDSTTAEVVSVGSKDVPEERRKDLEAYFKLITDNNIRILPQYLERVVKCPYNQAGALDNIVEWWNTDTEEWEMVVADLKTGRSLDLGWLEILIQLWSYANAEAFWTTTKIIRNDPTDPTKITDVEGYYEDIPRELRRDRALIFHVPLDGTATLYVLDLSGVERYVKAAVEAKRANAEAKKKVSVVSTYRPDAFVLRPASMAVPIQIDHQHPSDDTPMTVPFVPTPTAPTPDASAQEAKAAERMAMAERVTSDQAVTTPPVTIERDPVTGRKKRTCGHCHKPGHTQKNCPENPASPKYVPLGTRTDVTPTSPYTAAVPAGNPAPENNCDHLGDGDWHPYVAGQCPYKPSRLLPTKSTPNGTATVNSTEQEKLPYCPGPGVSGHGEWTSQHPDAPNQWVCWVCGKPGKRAYETGQTAVTPEPPFYGAPTVLAADQADGDDAPPPPAAWPAPMAPPDMVLWAINQAPASNDVLRIREEAIQSGTWREATHDLPARKRYEDLALQGE